MHSAAILTGGQARRFGGADKSALLVDGRTILERQMAMLAGVAEIAQVLLVGGAGEHPRARTVADRVAGSGPLGGIHAALSSLFLEPSAPPPAGAALFVLACDMPYVPAPLVAHLLHLARDADVVVPRTDRGYHPLCAVYTRACLDPIGRRLADRQLKVTGVLDDVRVRVVAGEELERFGDGHRLLSNVNTPGEHRAIQGVQDFLHAPHDQQ